MGLFGKSIGSIGGSEETCPWCGAKMDGDGERFECPNCTGGVFFMEDGELVDSMHRGKGSGSSETCISCGQPLRGDFSAPWEDGGNRYAYVRCKYCGHKNIKYGYGEDD
ncbi:MAG: hypothetical protein ABRQ25_06410 [Clostridiaceae bacterium]